MSPKKKRPKIQVMSSSGQTETERRQLRQSQRELHKKIISNEGDAMEDPNSNTFDEIREKNNVLWDKVRYTREAVLDGENLELISHRAARQAERLVKNPRYDCGRLVKKLRFKFGEGGGNFDWEYLGREVGPCFNALPSSVSFLHGPIDAEYQPKERKVRERKERPRVEEEEEEEEEEQQGEKNVAAADKLSAVEKSMKVIKKTLRERCKEELQTKVAYLESTSEGQSLSPKQKDKYIKNIQREGICAVKYLFNPLSFTQTVENIFHFSFLVKKGDAGIKVIKDNDGNARPTARMSTATDSQPEDRQTIASLSMKDWRNLVERYGVERCDIPHRTGSRHAGRQSMESSSR